MDLSNTVLFRGIMREQDELRRRQAESKMAEELAMRRSEAINRQSVEDHKMRLAEAKQLGASGAGLSSDSNPALQEAAGMGARMQQAAVAAAEAERQQKTQTEQLRAATRLGVADTGYRGRVESAGIGYQGRVDSAGIAQQGMGARQEDAQAYDTERLGKTQTFAHQEGGLRDAAALERARVMAADRERQSSTSNRGVLYQRLIADKALIENQLKAIDAKYKSTPMGRLQGEYEYDAADQQARATLQAQLQKLDADIGNVRSEMLGNPVLETRSSSSSSSAAPLGVLTGQPALSPLPRRQSMLEGQPELPPLPTSGTRPPLNFAEMSEDEIAAEIERLAAEGQ